MLKLKQMKIWLCWNYIEVKGKKTKKPVAADGGVTGTNNDYQKTWVTYDEAVSAKQRMSADGIGFVIPRGYFFLDIDHEELTNPFVQMMLKRFSSYAEISPSGNGLHIYGIADITKLPIMQDKNGKQRIDRQFYVKNPNNGMELYIGGLTNRFATFTGYAVHDVPLRECTEAVLTTLDKDMRRSQPKNYSAKRDGNRNTFDVICNLRKQKNGAKFVKLFDKGDFSDYGSQSEADLALCTMLHKAILALQIVIRNSCRFSEPKSVISARKQYMSDNNTVISFWNECMMQRNRITDKATVGKIYDVYKAWCQDNNSGYAKSAKEFRSIISEYLKTPYADLTIRTKAGIVYQGYTLSTDTKQQYSRICGYDEFPW